MRAIGTSAIAFLSVAIFVFGPASGVADRAPAEHSDLAPRSLTSGTHAPVRINGNSELAASDLVSSGSGLPGDPYVIKDWEIDGGGYGYALYVGNTTAQFLVQNCTLRNATGGSGNSYFYRAGVILYNVKFASVESSNLTGNGVAGAYVQFSQWTNFTGNRMVGNPTYGFQALASSYVNLRNNTATTSAAGLGLYLSSTSHSNLTGNAASGNKYGAFLSSGTNISLYQNNLSDNIGTFTYGVYVTGSTAARLTGNTIRGNGDAGVQLASGSHRASLSDNEISANGRYGLTAASSNNVSLKRNELAGNGWTGAYFFPSNPDAWIEGNNLSDNNGGPGVFVGGLSHRPTIIDNIANSNSQNGIHVANVQFPVVRGNTASWNTERGIRVETSTSALVERNTADSNTQSGIHLYSNTGATVRGNNASSNGNAGIELFIGANANIVEANNATGNAWGNIYVYASSSNRITRNNASGGPSSGIAVSFFSNLNRIDNNTASSNTQHGISVSGNSVTERLSGNIVANNTAAGNGWYGLYALYSDYMNISGNLLANNSGRGLYIGDVDNTTVSGNRIISNGERGIKVDLATDDTFDSNVIAFNAMYGIEVHSTSFSNLFHHNDFWGNAGGGKQASDANGGNRWNESWGGNYWDDFDSPAEGCNDVSPSDGFCDSPYVLDGGAGASDFLPITGPVMVPESSGASMALIGLVVALGSIAARGAPSTRSGSGQGGRLR